MLKDLSPESSFHKYAYSDSGFGRGRGEQERIPKTALSRRKQLKIPARPIIISPDVKKLRMFVFLMSIDLGELNEM